MQAQGTVVVTREVRIKATPETIFGFLVDPEKMMRWKGVEATLEPKPGGKYRVNVTGKAVVAGEYVLVEPPRRVVFTWGWEGDPNVPPGSSTVEITLTPEGDETVVTLTHRDLPEAAGPGHAEGWEHFLPRLVEAAEGRDPGPDPWVETEGGM
ncbi:MAG: SRPBCC domain-containing protein [Actinobacteria bacterium]|nr:SRPBCC domain-containing protein [Actinomycetota bacterium]